MNLRIKEELFDKFSAYLIVERGYSINTAKVYISDVRQLLGFVEPPDIYAIEAADIRNFLTKMFDDGLVAKTRARKLSSVKSFFTFLNDVEIRDDNPTQKIKGPKVPKTIPNVLSKDQMFKALNVQSGTPFIVRRDAAILYMLYATGMRLAELENLRVGDLNRSRGFIKILGKGGKERIIPTPQGASEALESYITARYSLLRETEIDTDFLLLNRRGNKLSRRGIQKIVKARLLEAGIENGHVHMIRATFATHMLENGADLKVIQELLGHKNLSTTEQYLAVSKDRMKDVYNEAHPLMKSPKISRYK